MLKWFLFAPALCAIVACARKETKVIETSSSRATFTRSEFYFIELEDGACSFFDGAARTVSRIETRSSIQKGQQIGSSTTQGLLVRFHGAQLPYLFEVEEDSEEELFEAMQRFSELIAANSRITVECESAGSDLRWIYQSKVHGETPKKVYGDVAGKIRIVAVSP